MKAFLSDIIPKLQQFSKKLDELTLLLNHHWILIEQSSASKRTYIFRENNELLISINGLVEKAKWDYLGNKSLLIESSEGSLLFKIGFFDENILALKLDNAAGYVILVNETRALQDLNSLESILDFLSNKYLRDTSPQNEVASLANQQITKGKNEALPLYLGISILILGVVLFFILSKNDQESQTGTFQSTWFSTAHITLGSDTILMGEKWEIKITVEDDRLKSYDNFPYIVGFKMHGTSTTSNTKIQNGEIKSSQSIIMTYFPIDKGIVTVNDFEMKVNGVVVKSSGKSVVVL
jgi:BatD DUF11 like domain